MSNKTPVQSLTRLSVDSGLRYDKIDVLVKESEFPEGLFKDKNTFYNSARVYKVVINPVPTQEFDIRTNQYRISYKVCAVQHNFGIRTSTFYSKVIPYGYLGIAKSLSWDLESSEYSDEELIDMAIQKFSDERTLEDFFVYTCDEMALRVAYYRQIWDESSTFITKHEVWRYETDDLLRAALDIEHCYGNEYKRNPEKETNPDGPWYWPETNQSPIIKVQLKNPEADGNWWPDSFIHVEGFFTREHAFMTFQADTTALIDKSDAPKIPLFLGKFDEFGDYEYNHKLEKWEEHHKEYYPLNGRNNTALFSGTWVPSDFDFKNTNNLPHYDESLQETIDPFKPIMPIKRTYDPNPGNGITNVIVNSGIEGKKYQAHFLQTVAPGGAGAFDQATSSYSDRVHISPAYIAHHENGVYGHIHGIISISQLSILEGDMLDVQPSKCNEDGTALNPFEFKVTKLDSLSPFTQLGGVPFSPTAVGVIQES